MLLNEFITGGVSSLGGLYPEEESRNIILMVTEAILGVKKYTHIIDPMFEIDPSKKEVLESALNRLAQGEPVQYVLGYADFRSLRFNVGPGVLIPRPETEKLVEEVLKTVKRIQRLRSSYGKRAKPVRVLDLCTGTGCIAWSIAIEACGVEVVAADISDAALEIARSQEFSEILKEHKAQAPVFVRADILDTEKDFGMGEFDVIVSNPPYILESEKPEIRKNVLEYEPQEALFVPDDNPMVFNRAIAGWCGRYLRPGGVCMVEINEMLGETVSVLFKASSFKEVTIIKDYFNKDRFISFVK